jgi:hypothetical protein
MRLSSRPAMVRIAVIDREIRDGRLPNATSLAQQLEVNSRTVHRDLDCLRDQLGAPLQFDRDRNGYYYTNAFWRIPLPQLSEGVRQKLFVQAVATNLPRDKVVPPEQALAMVEALRQKKLAVAYVPFVGDQHRFRPLPPAGKALKLNMATSTGIVLHQAPGPSGQMDYFNTNPFSLLHLTNRCADKDRGAA